LFVEAVVFLGAILGILLIVSSFAFHIITRKDNPANVDIEQLVDNVADEALEEINKTAKLVLDELNEKYNALLFVYQLMDDKQKELENPENAERLATLLSQINQTEPATEPTEPTGLDITIDNDLDFFQLEEKLSELSEESDLITELATTLKSEPEPELKPESESEQKSEQKTEYEKPAPYSPPQAVVIHPKHAVIKELQAQGLSLSDIARHLDMGQGEIQLIIGLGGR